MQMIWGTASRSKNNQEIQASLSISEQNYNEENSSQYQIRPLYIIEVSVMDFPLDILTSFYMKFDLFSLCKAWYKEMKFIL